MHVIQENSIISIKNTQIQFDVDLVNDMVKTHGRDCWGELGRLIRSELSMYKFSLEVNDAISDELFEVLNTIVPKSF